MMSPFRFLAPFTCAGLVAACGGAAAPPPEPEVSPAPPPAAAPEPVAEAPAGDADAGAPEPAGPAAESEPEPSAPAEEAAPAAPSRRPIDLLTAPTVSFMLDYNASDLKEAAMKKCDSESEEDPAARAECLRKERAAFVADALVFKKEGEKWSWIIYRRQRNDLLEVSTSQVEFGEEKEASVVVKVKSDKGTRPLFAGQKQIVVSVPTNYTVELQDPKFGRVVYEAKVGLVAD